MPKKAFSLIELLIYVSIFAVVAGLMTSILITILKVSQKESASIETSEQLSFVMQTVSRLIRESSNIETASAGSLKLRMKDIAKDPTCLYLENQIIKLAEGPDSLNPQNCNFNASSSLTSSKVIADKLEFSKITNYPGHDVVSIDIQLTYNSNNPQSQTTRNLKSAIARVSAATFDDNLIPGSDAQYDLGFSPNTRWKNANFSGDLLVAGNIGIGTMSPGAELEVAGQIKITGGMPGADKVLVSDAGGLASWQTQTGVPPGAIVMWSGLLANIPSGWALCDGSNGTPDLRDRFILGAAVGENPGATGGSNSITLTTDQLPAHTHVATMSEAGEHTHRIGFYNNSPGSSFTISQSSLQIGITSWLDGLTLPSGLHTHNLSVSNTGNGSPIDSRPNFYKLAFIMKL